MIDSETLYQWELDAVDAGMHRHAEAFRHARRYLALRENEAIAGVQVGEVKSIASFYAEFDAAADRLLEGGE